MMATRARIELDKEWLANFCQRNGIRKLSLFGSVLRDDFDDESDVDVLVEFEPEAKAKLTLLTLAHMENEFSDHLGRKVDLRMPTELSKYIVDRVLADAEVQYVHR
jgi:predicted nucleotidyltransferase